MSLRACLRPLCWITRHHLLVGQWVEFMEVLLYEPLGELHRPRQHLLAQSVRCHRCGAWVKA
jgi:hypothetical protein